MEKMRGIFRYGDYGWLGRYRANAILATVRKALGEDVKLEPIVPLDIFHACYLLNTSLVEQPRRDLVEVTKPVLEDEELRRITVADDLVSRVFAAKYAAELVRKLKRLAEDGDESARQLLNSLSGSCACKKGGGKRGVKGAGGSGGQAGRRAGAKMPSPSPAVGRAIASALGEAKEAARRAKAIVKIGAGVGKGVSSFTLGELLDLRFAVDVEELLRVFREIDAPLRRALRESLWGEYAGIKFGRDLSRLAPSALALPDELFWYRYATSTLPQLETRVEELERFIVMIDKSGSMHGRKTLWARAVALALAKLAHTQRIEAYCGFFDYEVHRVYDLRREFPEALKAILCVVSEGDTSIDTALREADRYRATIILITDGEDAVTYRPRNRLISVMVEGRNEALREASDEYLRVEPDREGMLRLFRVMRG